MRPARPGGGTGAPAPAAAFTRCRVDPDNSERRYRIDGIRPRCDIPSSPLRTILNAASGPGRRASPTPVVLQLLRRLVRRPAAPVAALAADADGARALSTCRAGIGAMVLEVRCGDQEACRLRALGLCEGAHVNVVDARHAMLLDVRGTRIAIGRALSAAIQVRPLADGVSAPAATAPNGRAFLPTLAS